MDKSLYLCFVLIPYFRLAASVFSSVLVLYYFVSKVQSSPSPVCLPSSVRVVGVSFSGSSLLILFCFSADYLPTPFSFLLAASFLC